MACARAEGYRRHVAATREQADAWLTRYGAAWEAADGDAAARLFAEDAQYCWGPYDPVLTGRAAIRDRWSQATAEQRDVRFAHDVLGIDGDRVFAHWRSTFLRRPDGPPVELDGVFVLDFWQPDLCGRLQEWWLARS